MDVHRLGCSARYGGEEVNEKEFAEQDRSNGLSAVLDWASRKTGNIMNITVVSVEDAIELENNQLPEEDEDD